LFTPNESAFKGFLGLTIGQKILWMQQTNRFSRQDKVVKYGSTFFNRERITKQLA
jgi:hypothetical protein